MSESERMKRLELVLSPSDMGRLRVVDEELLVDVHGLTCRQAMQLLKNVIALMNGSLNIDVVHGYNRGHAIKEMLKNDFLSKRVIRTESVAWNPGMTKIVLA